MMKLLSVMTAVALLFGLAANSEAAAKAKKSAKGPVNGTILSVKPDDGKNTGTFTVQVMPKKKKGAPAPETMEEKTFKFTDATKFETLTGKKKNVTTSAATSSDLVVGKTVTITANGDTAEIVKITAGKKKKKNA